MSETATLLDFQSSTDGESTTEPTLDEDNTADGNPDTPPDGEGQQGDDHDDSICPIYEEAAADPEWQELKAEYSLPEPKCGHAIRYLTSVIDSKVAGSTGKGYASALKYIIRFLHENDVTVPEAEFGDFDDFMKMKAKQDVADGTIANYRTAASRLLTYVLLNTDDDVSVRPEAIQTECAPRNYKTRDPYEADYLEPEEIDALLDAVDEVFTGAQALRNRLLIEVGVKLGPRVSDLVSIKVEQLDLDEKSIELENTKGGGSYRLPLPTSLMLPLRRWLSVERDSIVPDQSNPYLFPSSVGGHISGARFRGILDKAAREADIQETVEIPVTPEVKELHDIEHRVHRRVTPHTLRRTFSMLLKDLGMSIEERSMALDHGSTDVTRSHYDFEEESIEEILRDRFDGLNV